MANWITISADRMRSDADTIQEQVERIPVVVSELETAMEKLGQCWEGVAWAGFQSQVASDIDDIRELYRFLSDYLLHLETSREKYMNAEEDIYFMAKGI